MGLAKTFFTIRQVGLLAYAKTKFMARGAVIPVQIGGRRIAIRTGTRDLSVAIDSLCHEYEGLSQLLPRDFAGLVVDAGGYIGTAAIRLSELYPRATVVSVEPSSANLQMLKRNTAAYPMIHVLHAALTCADGQTVKLRDPKLNEWGFTLMDIAGTDAPEVEEVATVSVEGLSHRFGKPVGFLKMDIEGAEVDVLTDKRLKAVAPIVLFVELHERTVPGCLAALRSFGSDRSNYQGSGEKYLSLLRGATPPAGYVALT